MPDEALAGVPCFGGLDLGQTDDFSAFALVFILPDGRVAVRMRYWLPEAALTTHPERPYGAWQRSGLLVVTEGEVSDPDQIEGEVAAACHQYGVAELAYDRRFAEQMRLHLEGEGIKCIDMPQGYQLNEAIRRIEELVKTGKLCHAGDPVLAWMASNVALRRGMRGEVRLDKEHAADKIDGVAALAMALGRALLGPGESQMSKRVARGEAPLVVV
jgi:phage terminase large subunit-like protein